MWVFLASRDPLRRPPAPPPAPPRVPLPASGMLWSPAVCGRLHTGGGGGGEGGGTRPAPLFDTSLLRPTACLRHLERRAPCVFRRNRSAPGRPERREVCAVEDLADSTFRSGSQSHKSRLVGVEFPLLLCSLALHARTSSLAPFSCQRSNHVSSMPQSPQLIAHSSAGGDDFVAEEIGKELRAERVQRLGRGGKHLTL